VFLKGGQQLRRLLGRQEALPLHASGHGAHIQAIGHQQVYFVVVLRLGC
jgi:hypothetical protein